MGVIHDVFEKDRFEKKFGKRACCFQIEHFGDIRCLLASSMGGFGTDNSVCLCRKDICPLFQIWKKK